MIESLMFGFWATVGYFIAGLGIFGIAVALAAIVYGSIYLIGKLRK